MRTHILTGAAILLVSALSIGASPEVGPRLNAAEKAPPAAPRHAAPARAAEMPEPGRLGVFHSQCALDHRAPDDPIVHPGHAGVSHSHDFFGAVGIDASSTPDSLRDGATTCRDDNDTAGYWVPTLYVDGQPITATFLNSYYTAGDKDRSKLQPFPAGLEMVAGGTKDTVTWECRDHGNEVPRATRNQFFRCQADWETVAHVKFPDCWNGRDLTADDQRSHMAYSQDGVCPADHPVPVPALNVHLNYGKNLPAGDVSLASGDPSTLHADFMNGWTQSRLEQLVQQCIRESRNCGEAHRIA